MAGARGASSSSSKLVDHGAIVIDTRLKRTILNPLPTNLAEALRSPVAVSSRNPLVMTSEPDTMWYTEPAVAVVTSEVAGRAGSRRVTMLVGAHPDGSRRGSCAGHHVLAPSGPENSTTDMGTSSVLPQRESQAFPVGGTHAEGDAVPDGMSQLKVPASVVSP